METNKARYDIGTIIQHPVDSSNIKSVGYTLTGTVYQSSPHTLQVEFQSGAVYRYFGVPWRTVAEILRFGSFGKAINKLVRGKYDYSVYRRADSQRG